MKLQVSTWIRTIGKLSYENIEALVAVSGDEHTILDVGTVGEFSVRSLLDSVTIRRVSAYGHQTHY